MAWQEELAAKVAALKDSDWEGDKAPIQVRCDWSFAELDEFVGSVNASPFLGIGAECLYLHWVHGSPNIKTELCFVLKRRSWNEFLYRDGKWKRLENSLPYLPMDFNAIK